MNRQWCLRWTVWMIVAAGPMAEAAEPANDSPPEVVKAYLKAWETGTPRGQVVEVRFERYIYDNVFFIEKRGRGRFVYQAPDQGLFVLEPAKISGEEVSRRSSSDGTPYDLRPCDAMMWYWDGKWVYEIDTATKSYHRIPFPKLNINERTEPKQDSQQGARQPGAVDPAVEQLTSLWQSYFDVLSRMLHGPRLVMPMTLEIDAGKLAEDYQWYEIKPRRTHFGLRAVPRRQVDAQEFKLIDILIDEEKQQTYATRMVDPTGNRETVSVINEIRTGKIAEFNWRPDLRGYKVIDNGGNAIETVAAEEESAAPKVEPIPTTAPAAVNPCPR